MAFGARGDREKVHAPYFSMNHPSALVVDRCKRSAGTRLDRSAVRDAQPRAHSAPFRNRDSRSKGVSLTPGALRLSRAGDGEAIQSQFRQTSNAETCDQSRGHKADRARVRVGNKQAQKKNPAGLLARANESPRKAHYRT